MDKFILKKSCKISFYIVTGLSTASGILGYTIRDCNDKLKWWSCLIILFGVFLFFGVIAYFVLKAKEHCGYSTNINGKQVSVVIGDLFQANGWKVIPFNERFDTQVDDIIISHNSLNGIMIDKYISDVNELNQVIENAQNDNSEFKSEEKNGRLYYPLGRIIPYDDFLLLALSHFDDQNRAYIGIGEYEQLLIRMWTEIRRVYAAKPICIPLIGAGITDIRGEDEKDYTKMLKCILCTLRSSKFKPEKGITIVLTQEIAKKINMNNIREEF